MTQVPEHIRSFIWLIMHIRLLTKSLKSKMGLCHSMCDLFGDKEETILHCKFRVQPKRGGGN
jgi:hypothetical protein